jgi:hypothetical protein
MTEDCGADAGASSGSPAVNGAGACVRAGGPATASSSRRGGWAGGGASRGPSEGCGSDDAMMRSKGLELIEF